MIQHLLAGFALGWVGSMPIAGAVSIFIFQRGLAGRLKAGLVLACGAAVAEAAWCLLALRGAEKIITRWPAAETIAKGVGAIILVALGIYFFTRKTPVPQRDENSESSENLLKQFWLGFTLVAGNPAVPINLLALLTVAVGLGFQPDAASPLVFVLAVAVGIVGWFATLLKILDHFHSKIQSKHIQIILRAMGLMLVLVAIISFFRK